MAASSYHLLSNIFRTPPPVPPSSAFFSFLFRRSVPILLSKSSSVSTFAPLRAVNRLTSSRQVSDLVERLRTRSVAVNSDSLYLPVEDSVDDEDDEFDEEEDVDDSEYDDESDGEGEVVEEIKEKEDEKNDEEVVNEAPKLDRSKLPKLTIKEKKELASYAHSLGKKLKIQLVGKSGVTASVASSFVETLEANELLKIKIHATCPGEVPDVAKQLEDSTGSVVVGQIGRTIILYRPSLSKMKAEEKRRQEMKVYVKKTSVFKPSFPNKGGTSRPSERTPRPNGRGTRGSSRMRTAE
ncbi:hypothetical protein QQ045_032870 [Rhodiola kirilowii]